MWDKKKKAPVVPYLICIVVLWISVFVVSRMLTEYSVLYKESGVISWQYIVYVIVGMLFTTPAPMIALFITLRRSEGITVKEYFKKFLYTENKILTAVVTGGFCLLAVLFAIMNGIPNGTSWYMMPVGFLVMIPFVGIAEETGWRGLLQPAMEEKAGFIVGTIITAAIWGVWHVDLWFDPTSNHYGDSFIGFLLNIVIWSFALAAIYKSTRSVAACAIYHAFIDSIGAIYDWNLLFDSFPGNIAVNLYRLIILIISITLWIYSDRKRIPELMSGE